MRSWMAIVLLAAVMVACDDPVGLVEHDDAGSGVDTGPSVPPDAATTEDVGVPDTGEPADTGLQPGEDAGEPADAAEPGDAAEPPDAAEPQDAAEPRDAAEPPDAAAPVDGGVRPDAAAPPDAAVPPDAGAWDGGGRPDTGPRPDAAAPGPDASSEPPDGGGGTGAIGQPCADETDCSTDTCLGTDDGWPAEGSCAQSGCDPGNPVATCPAGGRCRNIDPSGWRPMCLDLCKLDGTDDCVGWLTCTKHGNGSNAYYVCEPPPP